MGFKKRHLIIGFGLIFFFLWANAMSWGAELNGLGGAVEQSEAKWTVGGKATSPFSSVEWEDLRE